LLTQVEPFEKDRIEKVRQRIAGNFEQFVPAGKIDERIFTGEDVEELRSYLSSEAWDKIVGTMQKLTLATGYFKGLSDAGFLQKS
jgi:hypothetical protein